MHSLTSVLVLLAVPGLPNAAAADQKDVMRQLQHAYYNLRTEGLASYRCTAQPDWNVSQPNASADPGNTELRALLEGTTFEVAVGPEGAAIISRQSRIPPTSEQAATRLRMIAIGVEQSLAGFFQVLATFAFGRATSPSGPDFKFTETLSSYRITQEDGSAVGVIIFNHDLTARELKCKTPQMEGTFYPRFTRTNKGYVLQAYQGSIEIGVGAWPKVNAEMEAQIEYREIEGFKLPAAFITRAGISGSTTRMKFRFDNYQVTKR